MNGITSHLADPARLPTFGDRPLSSILPDDVQAWVKRLGATLAPSTIGVAHSIVSSVMKAAVRDRRLIASPCEGRRLPKASKSKLVPLTTGQIDAALEAMPAELQALVVLAAGTGMRQGECLGLTVDRLDLLRREVIVDRQMLTIVGQPPHPGPPRTAEDCRTIPLPRVVVDALAAHLSAYPAEPAGGLLFTIDGLPISRQKVGHPWHPVVKAAGLPQGTGFHALRHYCASLLILHGESVKTVQARLGHASAVETPDTTSTCGRTPMTAHARPSTPFSVLLRTPPRTGTDQ